ncbi:MAG TPA: tryptophan synthase subunit alpha, partial [Spirochaetes bacterium]|nr:tryptophan synthase subunit alpha [Spirochaetota bacterium]
TPATVPSRVPQIIKACHGFLYFVSVIGITGQRTEVNKEIRTMIENLKTQTDLPICVGFGISQKEHVHSVVQYADGAIVGSAIVQRITDHIDSPDLSKQVTRMIQDLGSVLSNGDDK